MAFEGPEDISDNLPLGERVEGYTGFVEDFIKTYLPSSDQLPPLSAIEEIKNALTTPLPYDPRQLFYLTTVTANNFSLIIRALGTTKELEAKGDLSLLQARQGAMICLRKLNVIKDLVFEPDKFRPKVLDP